ncbi:MAG: 3-hydroxyacyl-CoA dehydrogenase NAD-binding domain-containing protein, partial [Phycisphaeraceae bacterium]
MNLHRVIENDIMHVRFDCADRPVNTISPQVLDELDGIVSKLESGEEKPRAVIFESGKAGTFITGADLFAMREMSDAEVARFIERGQQLFHRISKLPMVTVAAINGQCLGGGLELTLACTHRVAADDGSINIGLPEVKLGILPGWGGSTRLPRLIGLTRALPLLLTGRMLAPRKALALGVIDEVVPPEALPHAAKRLAQQKRRGGNKISQADRAIARFNPLRNAAMKRARAQTLATTHGNYPAPEAVLDVVEIGMGDGIEAGLRAEREALQRLVKTDACRNLMRLFFLRQESKRAVREKLKAEPRDVKRVAVVGGGVMGSGIVHALVSAGVDVRLIEIEAKQMSAALTRVKKQLDAELKSKRISPVQAKRAMHRVSPSLTFTGLGRVDFVIEAVLERPAVKRDVFDLLDGILRPDAVLASNTSSLNLTELAEATAHPERVMGMHFFNPVPKMPLLEVVRTPLTDDAALATGVALGQRIGKTPILVDDGPGFLVNRVLIPYLAEAIVLASEGAPIDEVDRVMKR